MITGIDISDKNGSLIPRKLIGNDIHFAYIKASEALNSADRCYKENISIAKKQGLLVGAYHWLHPRLHVGQQAEFFMEMVGNFSGMLPPVVCLNTHRARIEEIEKNIQTFLKILKSATGVNPVIFTSAQYWENFLPSAGWASEYPLWIDYPGSNWPAQLFPWAGWHFWQKDDRGKMPGVLSEVGLNVFNGSRAELEQMVVR